MKLTAKVERAMISSSFGALTACWKVMWSTSRKHRSKRGRRKQNRKYNVRTRKVLHSPFYIKLIHRMHHRKRSYSHTTKDTKSFSTNYSNRGGSHQPYANPSDTTLRGRRTMRQLAEVINQVLYKVWVKLRTDTKWINIRTRIRYQASIVFTTNVIGRSKPNIATYGDNLVLRFDNDSVPIKIDNCCTRTMSHCK